MPTPPTRRWLLSEGGVLLESKGACCRYRRLDARGAVTRAYAPASDSLEDEGRRRRFDPRPGRE